MPRAAVAARGISCIFGFNDKENTLVSEETRVFLGGDYWTRTSGLMRVKHAL